jgi:hypothetical protein
MADIFLSYCSADRNIARKFVDSLAAEGLTVWWDDRLTPIEQWDRLIEKEIRAASAVLVLWTPRAIESDWVRVEANFGRDRKKLLQARLEDCDVPLQFTLLQWVDLDAWLASGDIANWRRLITCFRALMEARTPVPQPVQAPPAAASPVAPHIDDFADALADIARTAARSGSGRYDDVVIPELGERWPAFIADYRLGFGVIEQALTVTQALRAKLVEAGLHLSLYFMRLHDESQSFHSLGMAMRAMKAADASELADFLPSLRSVARIAIEELEPEDMTHYALGRMLGATARHMCAMAPEPVKREWLAATSITLSAYGGRSKSLTSGFREMSGDAGYSVEIVRFEVPEVGSSFASALLDEGDGAGLADHALKRFSALKDA